MGASSDAPHGLWTADRSQQYAWQFTFPLHLLAFTLVAALLAFLAKRSSARLAAWVFGLVVILTAIMALRQARGQA